MLSLKKIILPKNVSICQEIYFFILNNIFTIYNKMLTLLVNLEACIIVVPEDSNGIEVFFFK